MTNPPDTPLVTRYTLRVVGWSVFWVVAGVGLILLARELHFKDMTLYPDPAWLTDVLENTEPVLRSNFTVYYRDNQLLYTGTECSDKALTPRFAVHIIPVNVNDLPVSRRREGIQHSDFDFKKHQLPLDAYFPDQPPPNQMQCAALIDLPAYDIARVRTGQYIPDGEWPWLWEGQIRLDIDAAWLADMLENTEPVLRGAFTVYHHDNRLLYTSDTCNAETLTPPVFAHVVPVNPAALPASHRQAGFHNLDFHFQERQLPLDAYFPDQPPPNQTQCAALIDLPAYDIARVRTGQYVPDGPQLWAGTIRPDIDVDTADAAWLADVLENTEPVLRGAFTVYHHDNRLLYTSDTCNAETLTPPVFAHVVPVNAADLPESSRQAGFHNLDFHFQERQLPLDAYFPDQPPPNQMQCAALIDLPAYDIARVRTGQYVPDGPQLWAGTIRPDIDVDTADAAWLADVLENTEPVLRGAFTVYHHDNRLLYTSDTCNAETLTPPVFAHVVPVNAADLPESSRQAGFHNLDFHFQERQLPLDAYFPDQPPPNQMQCAALIDLPAYDIARVRTGQYVPDGPQLWAGTIRPDIDVDTADAAWLADVLENTEPVLRGAFTVYHHDNRLLYTSDTCNAETLAPPVFAHVAPVNAADLPESSRQAGFHNLDFHFQERQLPLDAYFPDQPPPNQMQCAALIDLPAYDIARVRTGQYVPDGPQLWTGEFETGEKTPRSSP